MRSKHNSRFYAIKVLNKEKVVKMKQVEHTNSEREMLVRVRHPFLVNLWGTFQDVNNLYMVMDFVAGGELFSLLRKSQVRYGCMSPLTDVCSGSRTLSPSSMLRRLHSHWTTYIHWTSSIETSSRRTSSWEQTAMSRSLTSDSRNTCPTSPGRCVAPLTIVSRVCCSARSNLSVAPEVVQSKGYNKSVDWYALGVLIFEMLVCLDSVHEADF